jgi:hypothetical protein
MNAPIAIAMISLAFIVLIIDTHHCRGRPIPVEIRPHVSTKCSQLFLGVQRPLKISSSDILSVRKLLMVEN